MGEWKHDGMGVWECDITLSSLTFVGSLEWM